MLEGLANEKLSADRSKNVNLVSNSRARIIMLQRTQFHSIHQWLTAGTFVLLASGVSLIIVGVPDAFAQTAGDMCTADVDCDWDNRCEPQRCVAAPDVQLTCTGASPAPGTCSCINDRCTLRLEGLAAGNGITPSCSDTSECLFDPTSGRCTHANGNVDLPITSQGAYCTCESSACMVQWVDPIPCESALDCAVGTDPLRPLPAVPARTTAFEPCVDGEVAPICTPEGFCMVAGLAC